jgi:NAD(P)-dependent dehydrogenase (short-subunit alcohol dehydrogenase family)
MTAGAGRNTSKPGSLTSLDPLVQFTLAGRVALVTGASSGLGVRFARVLDAAGARVVLVARRRERLDALAAELAEALVVTCDLSRAEELERPVAEAVSAFGRLDIVVNNAGLSDHGPALEEPAERFSDTLAVNLVAPFVLAQRAARDMYRRGEGGSIVNIASVLGLVGLGRMPLAGYAASKGGLVNLTRELAAQWSRDGIRVNAIAPGWFASEMTQELFAGERGQAFIRHGAPMGRPGEEHELDGALLFLASDASSYVTGQVIPVDGGWSAV